MTKLALDCGGATDIGLVRDHNEDRYWIDPEGRAFLVVDGVGGHAAGERAAEIAVQAIQESVSGGASAPPDSLVREAITAANNRIYNDALERAELAGMACVLTLALVDGEQVTVGHVGDSRLYLIGDGAIRKVTSDHSPVGQFEDAGELNEEEAMAHPRRNEVYRDVGSCLRSADDENFVELCNFEIRDDTAMLLCSDGLSDHLTSNRIREIVERYAGSAAQIAHDLVDAGNDAGGRDNITVVLVTGSAFPRRKGGATRPRLAATRIRAHQGMWRGRLAFLSYGLLLGMLLWAVLHIRG